MRQYTAGDALALSRTTGGRVVRSRANISTTLTPCMGIATTSAIGAGNTRGCFTNGDSKLYYLPIYFIRYR